MTVRLTVVTSEFGAASHVGGVVETVSRTFDLPKEVSDYIENEMGEWTSVILAIDRDQKEAP